jgi:hypothetical protein
MYRNLLVVLGLLAGLGASLTSSAVNAADPVYCGQYTSDAMKSVLLAKHLKCGFQGPRWNNDKASHMAWCLFVPQNIALSETDARSANLKLCTCQWYADQTMVQIAMNIANKCGFTGLRWLDDKKAHYDWCFNVNPPFSAMSNEIDIRKKMLKGC